MRRRERTQRKCAGGATARAEDAACAACWAPACVFIGIWLACGVRWDVIACLYGWSLLFVLLVHSRAPSALCIATQSLILGTPYLVNAQTMRHEADVPAFRVVFSFCALYVLARALQVIQHRSWYETRSRLTTFCTVDWFVLAAAHDTRAVCFEAQRGFDGSVLRTYLTSMAATAAAATAAPLLQGVWWGVPQSIVLGLCAMSALFVLDAFFRGLWLAAGVRLRSTMNSPWRSTSVSEFWGSRWDRFVRDMLSDLAFKPLRSAALHVSGRYSRHSVPLHSSTLSRFLQQVARARRSRRLALWPTFGCRRWRWPWRVAGQIS